MDWYFSRQRLWKGSHSSFFKLGKPSAISLMRRMSSTVSLGRGPPHGAPRRGMFLSAVRAAKRRTAEGCPAVPPVFFFRGKFQIQQG